MKRVSRVRISSSYVRRPCATSGSVLYHHQMHTRPLPQPPTIPYHSKQSTKSRHVVRHLAKQINQLQRAAENCTTEIKIKIYREICKARPPPPKHPATDRSCGASNDAICKLRQSSFSLSLHLLFAAKLERQII